MKRETERKRDRARESEIERDEEELPACMCEEVQGQVSRFRA